MILLNKFIFYLYVNMYETEYSYELNYNTKKIRYFMSESKDAPELDIFTELDVYVSLNSTKVVTKHHFYYDFIFHPYHEAIGIYSHDGMAKSYCSDWRYSEITRKIAYYLLYNVFYSKDKPYQDKYRNALGNMEI